LRPGCLALGSLLVLPVQQLVPLAHLVLALGLQVHLEHQVLESVLPAPPVLVLRLVLV